MANTSPLAEKYHNRLALYLSRTRHQWGRLFPGPYTALVCLLALAAWVWVGVLWLSHPTPHPSSGPPTPQAATRKPAPEAPKAPATAAPNIPMPAATEASLSAAAPEVPVAPAATMRPYLGIRGETFRQGPQRGLKILEVFPRSPAALAGLRSADDPMRTGGDIITKANGRPIASQNDLKALLQASKPGDVIRLLVSSAGGESFRVVPVTLGAIPVQAVSQSRTAQAGVKSTPHHAYILSRLEQEIFDRVNQVREEYGRRPLIANTRLDEAARRHSQRMAALDYFAHTDPDGQDVVDRLRTVGIDQFSCVGENIFYGQNLPDIVHAVVQGWLTSPPHRENLLSRHYAQAGIGVASGPGGRVYVTQDYLQR